MPDDSPMTECPQSDRRLAADPTVLTTEALQRAISTLKESITLQATHESEAREAADVAIQKFGERELELIERQRVEQKKDTKDAVDAALAAAKEAVKEQTTASGLSIAKSENATNEQLKQLNVTFTTAITGVDRQISDLKDRVGKNENVQAHERGETKGTDAMMPWVFAIVASVVAVVSIIVQLSH